MTEQSLGEAPEAGTPAGAHEQLFKEVDQGSPAIDPIPRTSSNTAFRQFIDRLAPQNDSEPYSPKPTSPISQDNAESQITDSADEKHQPARYQQNADAIGIPGA
jgi:hypothetical protein